MLIHPIAPRESDPSRGFKYDIPSHREKQFTICLARWKNVFKGLANLGELIKHARQIGGQMGQLTEEMKKQRVTGTAGGGMVEVEINGLIEVLRCHIDPQLFAQNDRELIEDLVVAAVNQAIVKGKQIHADALRDLTGGLPLPSGFQDALAKFTGEEAAEGGEPKE
jgi:DNA-binding YbaB/EbfC family protein